jgi:hypothetical protein
MQDIKYYSTEDLISEIQNRFDNTIFLAKTNATQTQYRRLTRFSGCNYTNLGLLQKAKDMCLEFISEDEVLK